jgi:hypothetical protein
LPSQADKANKQITDKLHSKKDMFFIMIKIKV